MINQSKTNLFGAAVLAVMVVALLGSPAMADFMGNVITVQATSEDGTAVWQAAFPPDPPDDQFTYRNSGPILLRDTSNERLIGSISDIEVTLDGDPMVNIAFSATAGSFGTTFTINSATVNFPALTNPQAIASANVTLTDTGTNGASMNLVGANQGVFLPLYNGGTLFFPLIGAQNVTSGGSVTVAESTGLQTISGSVNSILARFQFTLSALDNVTGTGNFTVIPEPGTIVLLSIGGVIAALAYRRRAKVA